MNTDDTPTPIVTLNAVKVAEYVILAYEYIGEQRLLNGNDTLLGIASATLVILLKVAKQDEVDPQVLLEQYRKMLRLPDPEGT